MEQSGPIRPAGGGYYSNASRRSGRATRLLQAAAAAKLTFNLPDLQGRKTSSVHHRLAGCMRPPQRNSSIHGDFMTPRSCGLPAASC